MKKKICLFLLTLCLLLSACASAAQVDTDSDPAPTIEVSIHEEAPAPEEPAVPEMPQREKDWIEDIEFLREEYKTKHKDPFYFCSEEEFDRKMDQLIEKVGELSDSDIFYELDAIISGMGDNHTRICEYGSLPICDRMIGVNIIILNGKLYLWSYLKNCEQFEPYLLHETVGVNGVESLYLIRRASSLYESDWLAIAAYLPSYPSFFDWVGCDYKKGYTFQILNDNQEVESVDIPVITLEEWSASSWIYPESFDSLIYLKGCDQTVYYEGKDGGCIQWCMGQFLIPANTGYNLRKVVQLIKEHPNCNKLVIDLRECPGGSAELLPFLEEIRKEAQILEEKQIYVLINSGTASAATRMIAFFKDEFDAVTVGEPTGQFSSFFSRSEESENSPTVLPHSQIKVQISDLWRDSKVLLPEMGVSPIFEEYYDEDGRLYEWETCIQPDVYIHMDIEDFRQGKDSVLEWVLAQ
ncbi:MAG: S41 family peptidase [Lachnospiraceae bacterium]|nr:S41 family peptidase [Lachnospiraceae bacterium]